MSIKSNLKSMTPRRTAYKREITLMSHGFNNKTAWPDGRLTVFPWDNAIDQWLMENVRRVSKQDLVYGLLKNCCDLNGGSVDDFVADEINVVLLVSRALSTEGIVMYTSLCPHCGFKKPEKIKIPDELEKIGEKTADYAGSDKVTLPDCGDVITLRPLLVKDEKLIINRPEDKRKAVPDAELRTLLRVVSINESQPDSLEELVVYGRALSPSDIKFLEDKGREITPHLNTSIPHICDDSDCGKKFNHPLNFDQEFFR